MHAPDCPDNPGCNTTGKIRLHRPTAKGLWPDMARAMATASAAALPAGTSLLTRPSRSASSAVVRTRSGTAPWFSVFPDSCPTATVTMMGASPTLTSGAENVALGVATTRSAVSKSVNPPPSAGPSTAAIRGLVDFIHGHVQPDESPPEIPDLAHAQSGVIAHLAAGAEHVAPGGKYHRARVRISVQSIRRSTVKLVDHDAVQPVASASGRFNQIKATRSRCSISISDAFILTSPPSWIFTSVTSHQTARALRCSFSRNSRTGSLPVTIQSATASPMKGRD